MNKKCYILNSDSGAGGVVRIEKGFADVDIKNHKPFDENEVLEVYIIADGKLCSIGKMSGGREKFVCRKPEQLTGVIITRGEKIELWGGKENIKETAEKLLYPEEEISDFFPRELTQDNYFGGGFKWKRINGYYSVYKYSIIMYVLSLENVRNAITRRGHYVLGTKKDNGMHISIAISNISDEENIFGELEEYSHCVNLDGKRFRALYAVIDESGEYFLY
ncbi:MAG: hypothetical protein IKB55_02905 [Clostridia bacterium]|nr:hypothetical protein [Clostridia bacterium]